ncbi:MAG: glycosyltransferase [Candidatus Omnitrophica bacterium]|nr:glycosyltransferase [Candidatus Omnitrophota bacterium]
MSGVTKFSDMKTKQESLVKLLIILSVIVSLVYIAVRTALFLFAEYTFIEKFFASLLVAGDLFIILHSTGYAVNIVKMYSGQKKEIWPVFDSLEGNKPSVAILVAARHEPKDILENTFITLKNINYENKKIYFLDDSSDEKYMREADELSRDYGLVLFRRSTRHGAKAGIVNDCLKGLSEDYVVIFDADQNPLPEFLNVLVPIMEADKKLAYIQTPQFYSNMEESRVARAAAFQQAVFYEYICEGKSSGGAMFCCGTNVIFRREALVQVGGLDESTVTEDFATSIKFHANGWKSLYYNHVYAFGIGPKDLTGYFKQQFRWATGTISVFKKIVWRFLTRPFSLSLFQWWEYFLSGSYYLIGVAFFILMICPVAYLLFKIPSFFANPEVYFIAFIPYFVLSMSVFYFILARRHYRAKDLFIGQLLASITFPVYINGALTAILGVKTTFGVTGKTRSNAMSYLGIWPQILMIFINLIAFTWGMNRFFYERNAAVFVNGIWTLYYFAVLSSVFYFNVVEDREISCKRVAKRLKFEYKVLGESGKYSRDTWKECISIFLPERVSVGTLLMVKLYMPGTSEVVIFEASVIWSSARRGFRGFDTGLGIAVISTRDKEKLETVLGK